VPTLLVRKYISALLLTFLLWQNKFFLGKRKLIVLNFFCSSMSPTLKSIYIFFCLYYLKIPSASANVKTSFTLSTVVWSVYFKPWHSTYICILGGIDFASVSTVCRLDFVIYPDSVALFDFHFITYVRIHIPITLIRHSFVNPCHGTILKGI